MAISINRKDILHKICAVLFFLFAMIYYRYYPLDPLPLYISCLVLCGLLIVLSLPYKFLFVFYLFISTYVVFLYPYFLQGKTITGFGAFNYAPFYNKTIYLMTL